jgi:hypothetical protein
VQHTRNISCGNATQALGDWSPLRKYPTETDRTRNTQQHVTSLSWGRGGVRANVISIHQHSARRPSLAQIPDGKRTNPANHRHGRARHSRARRLRSQLETRNSRPDRPLALRILHHATRDTRHALAPTRPLAASRRRYVKEHQEVGRTHHSHSVGKLPPNHATIGATARTVAHRLAKRKLFSELFSEL